MAPVITQSECCSRISIPSPEYLPFEDSGPETPSPMPDPIPEAFIGKLHIVNDYNGTVLDRKRSNTISDGNQ